MAAHKVSIQPGQRSYPFHKADLTVAKSEWIQIYFWTEMTCLFVRFVSSGLLCPTDTWKTSEVAKVFDSKPHVESSERGRQRFFSVTSTVSQSRSDHVFCCTQMWWPSRPRVPQWKFSRWLSVNFWIRPNVSGQPCLYLVGCLSSPLLAFTLINASLEVAGLWYSTLLFSPFVHRFCMLLINTHGRVNVRIYSAERLISTTLDRDFERAGLACVKFNSKWTTNSK